MTRTGQRNTISLSLTASRFLTLLLHHLQVQQSQFIQTTRTSVMGLLLNVPQLILQTPGRASLSLALLLHHPQIPPCPLHPTARASVRWSTLMIPSTIALHLHTLVLSDVVPALQQYHVRIISLRYYLHHTPHPLHFHHLQEQIQPQI